MDFSPERKYRMVNIRLCFCLASALVALCSVGYTNINQLVGVEISGAVLARMPTNDYSSAQLTLLSFERALHSGDFTNMFNCCTVDCNYEDLQVTNIAEVALSIIEGIRQEATNSIASVIDDVEVRVDSETEYKIIIRNRESLNGHIGYERMRFDIKRNDDVWKIDEWEDLLPGEDE